MKFRIAMPVLALGLSVLSFSCRTTNAPAGDAGSLESTAAGGRFTNLRTPTNASLKAFYATANTINPKYLAVYHFNNPTNEGTNADSRAKRIKEAMHRYQCAFFDESIALSRPNDAKDPVADILSSLDQAVPEENKAVFTIKIKPVLADKTLDVWAGSASGNNTMGYTMGVYDMKNNEVLFFGDTNCGSDN